MNMKKYSKTQKYDRAFVEENWMGPHPLMLLEEVCEELTLKPGMKVLDMGCGKGLTSIFLAKEYGVTVFANDLWISATDNLKRFEQWGVSDLVYPIHAEAHELPYAEGFFDAAICIDSYNYYGANETYFPEIYSKLVKSGGQFGIALPGVTVELNGIIPEHLRGIMEFEEEASSVFHAADWWKTLWNESGLVDITSCRELEDAREMWYEWAYWAKINMGFSDRELLDADKDKYLTLMVMTAIKK